MDEAEWLASTDLEAMLRYISEPYSIPSQGIDGIIPCERPSDRKLRLFACACCRAAWDKPGCPQCAGLRGHICIDGENRAHPANAMRRADYLDGAGDEWRRQTKTDWRECATCFSVTRKCSQCRGQGVLRPRTVCPACGGTGRVGGLTDERSRRAVEVAERFADGEATEARRRDAYMATEAVRTARWGQGGAPFAPDTIPDRMASWAVGVDMTNAANTIARHCQSHTAIPPAAQAALLRDIVGNPFTSATARLRQFQPMHDWLMWNDGTVDRLARGIYADRAFDRLPILADALEDAGCDDADILAHCRDEVIVRYRFAGATGTWGRHRGADQIAAAVEECRSHFRGLAEVWATPHIRGCWALDLILGKE